MFFIAIMLSHFDFYCRLAVLRYVQKREGLITSASLSIHHIMLISSNLYAYVGKSVFGLIFLA